MSNALMQEILKRARSGRLTTSMDPDQPAKDYPPVSSLRLQRAEAQLGFGLPPLLRELYMKVGNGGFGPGCGLFGIDGGFPVYSGSRPWTLVEIYKSALRSNQLGERWPDRQLMICNWGCDYYSYIDCALPQAPVFAIDLNSRGFGAWDSEFSLHAASFEEWMQRWVDDEDLWASIGLFGNPKRWTEDHRG